MLTDPYAMYARVRGPVTWNEQMGLWLVTRYDDVRWALGEPKLSSTMRRFQASRGLPLPRKAFIPPPPVDSAVLELRRRRR
jgi:cytochrome P450